MKKGQVALEFIMTYGWAILAVLVAIGALAYFGVLSPSKYLPDKCIFTTGLNCKDFAFTQSGNDLNVSFTITNNLGDSMIIAAGGLASRYKDATVGCDALPATIVAGDSKGFTCKFTGLGPGVAQSVKASVVLNYTLSQGVYGKRATGDISGTVQS